MLREADDGTVEEVRTPGRKCRGCSSQRPPRVRRGSRIGILQSGEPSLAVVFA